jgi:hypothetical protein
MATPIEDEAIRTLHGLCRRTLSEYKRRADETCELLSSLPESAVTMEAWIAALRRRSEENEAFERYRIVREQLFHALHSALRSR